MINNGNHNTKETSTAMLTYQIGTSGQNRLMYTTQRSDISET